VNCSNTERLLEKGETIAIPASNTNYSPDTITMPKGRGIVRQVQFFCNNNTLADLAKAKLSVLINGVIVLEDITLLKFSEQYAEQNRNIPMIILETSQVQLRASNTSTSAIDVKISFMYY
jgi:hypothetical protein